MNNNNNDNDNDKKKKNGDNEFINGDDICISCTGISYISQEMRSQGKRPICIGKKTIMSKKVNPQHYEKLKKSEKSLEKPHVQICIGYLQTYGRRDRLGLPPLFINGIEYNVQKDNSNKINKDKPTNIVDNQSNKKEEIPYQAALPLIFSMLTPTKEKYNTAVETTKWTYQMIEKGAAKQYKFITRFYKKNSVNLPSRMYKSAIDIFDNSSKTIERMEKAISRMWPWK